MAENSSAGFKVKIQRFGSYLSGMIMPNIGAFIAWGIITALFIPTGWLPNESLAALVGPMITYLLPLLIGFTGGKILYDARGGVVGATATMGVIVGADIPMFLGAMIMGPLGGYAIKKFDQAIHGKVRQGFEMLVNNFSAGIIAGILTLLAYLAIGPVVLGLNKALAAGVEVIVDEGLLPLASLFIEPAKILFLNNAINHGILSPLGIEQAAETGKSILFLLESNPGPGLGILLAYMFFGKGMAKQSSSGAAIIHFFGGIHEIYFPYILMKPFLLLAVIAGGMSGVFTFSLLGAGLVAPPSPGSIFALVAMTPRGGYFAVLAGVVVATAVSFAVASVILKASKAEEEDLSEAAAKMQEMKGKKSSAAAALGTKAEETKVENKEKTARANVNKIIFACDAGMGSSAMGASILRDKVKKAGLDIEVANTSINNLPNDADIVITHKDLTDRAKAKLPNVEHISVDNFLASPKYDELIGELKAEGVSEEQEASKDIKKEEVNKIIFACDAGMGSSAMGASILRDKVKKAGLDIEVANTSINNLPNDADIVFTHKDLTDRAKAKLPNANHISVDNFLASPKYDELIDRLK
ncbi:PTS mannitol-specific transporter subunit IIBC [Bacillus taeanensis]|uniref:PTS system mannitol-specific EIICB component n=1 Tax=Bacillus taeanensis TaxID=273032 RepID=A0A366XYS4_9BACI|nr:PTS mannitol transporter subunit IICBA [Bacillus taeanensis]RBW70718.1 PTS mannitol transporter subunit IICBA [Bacillus taeanensis]